MIFLFFLREDTHNRAAMKHGAGSASATQWLLALSLCEDGCRLLSMVVMIAQHRTFGARSLNADPEPDGECVWCVCACVCVCVCVCGGVVSSGSRGGHCLWGARGSATASAVTAPCQCGACGGRWCDCALRVPARVHDVHACACAWRPHVSMHGARGLTPPSSSWSRVCVCVSGVAGQHRCRAGALCGGVLSRCRHTHTWLVTVCVCVRVCACLLAAAATPAGAATATATSATGTATSGSGASKDTRHRFS